jgi:hypothetical protein
MLPLKEKREILGDGKGGLGDGHRWIIPYFKRRHSNMEVKHEPTQ